MSLSAKNPTSLAASRWGDDTSTNDVPGSPSSSRTRWARSRNPPSMPSKAWKNVTASPTTSLPTVRDTVLSTRLVAMFITRSPLWAGAIIIR